MVVVGLLEAGCSGSGSAPDAVVLGDARTTDASAPDAGTALPAPMNRMFNAQVLALVLDGD